MFIQIFRSKHNANVETGVLAVLLLMAMLKMLILIKFVVMVKKKKMMVKEDDGDGCGDGELSAIRGSQLPPLPRLHNGTTAPHASNTTRVHFVI